MGRTSLRTAVCSAGIMAVTLFAGVGFVCQTTVSATPAYAEEASTASASWSPEMDCGLCHTAETASLEDVAHGDSDLMAAAAAAGVASPTGSTDGEATDNRVTNVEEATENSESAVTDTATANQEIDRASTEQPEADQADPADEANTTAKSIEGDGAAATDSATATSTDALTCAFCHTDTEALTETHTEAEDLTDMPTRLSQKIDDEVCLSCHGSKEALAEATAGSTALTDTNGTTVNPHELPDSASHSTIKCVDCHRVHTDKDPAETASQKCMSCHHQNVYECYTCHD